MGWFRTSKKEGDDRELSYPGMHNPMDEKGIEQLITSIANKRSAHDNVVNESRNVGSSSDSSVNDYPRQYAHDVASMLVQHSSAAYCECHNTPLLQCGCPSEAAPVDNFVYTVRSYNKKTDASAFCGYDPDRRVILAAFRGTVSVTNWKANFNGKTVRDVDLFPKGVGVHSGFYKTYQSIKNEVIAGVLTVREAHPDYAIHVTGHSMGGALANILCADLVHNHGISPLVGYTFGQPRVFDSKGREFFNSLPGLTYLRVHNGHDPVPAVPPTLLGFTHVGEHVHFAPVNKNQEENDSGILPALSKVPASLSKVRISDHVTYAKRYGLNEHDEMEASGDNTKLKGEKPPEDPFDPKTRAFRNAVSQTLLPFLEESQVTFLVVHTPWCPKSRHFFPEFRKLATHFKDDSRVQFVAINRSKNQLPPEFVKMAHNRTIRIGDPLIAIFLVQIGKDSEMIPQLYNGKRTFDHTQAALTAFL